jgi:hypothetical protein
VPRTVLSQHIPFRIRLAGQDRLLVGHGCRKQAPVLLVQHLSVYVMGMYSDEFELDPDCEVDGEPALSPAWYDACVRAQET